MRRPAFAEFSNCWSSDNLRWERFATLRDRVPSGLVSVIPQPCTISTPYLSQYQRISDTGGAEPPQVSRDNLLRSNLPLPASSTCLMPCQIVGTPAEMVTSSSHMSCNNRSGDMKRCGITCLQPSIDAANGRPQPMAWNIGTMPHRESSAVRPMASVMAWVMVCR